MTTETKKDWRRHLEVYADSQTKREYQIYLACADDGNGREFMTGKPLKTFDEWLNS